MRKSIAAALAVPTILNGVMMLEGRKGPQHQPSGGGRPILSGNSRQHRPRP